MKHGRILLGARAAVPPTLVRCGAVDTPTGTAAFRPASGQALAVAVATGNTLGEMCECVKTRTELAGTNLRSIIAIRDDESAANTGAVSTTIDPGLNRPKEFGAPIPTAVPMIRNRKNPDRFRSASASPIKPRRGRVSGEQLLAGEEIIGGIRTGFCR